MRSRAETIVVPVLPSTIDMQATTVFLDELRKVVPPDILLHSEEARRPFECDGLMVYRKLPLLVALPEDAGQVRAILATCHQLGVPVVTRGAGTGLSGGALPLEDGLLLVLSRMNRILEIDSDNRTARVEPGVRNLAVSEAAAPHGLQRRHDPADVGVDMADHAVGLGQDFAHLFWTLRAFAVGLLLQVFAEVISRLERFRQHSPKA